jgi:hypothetical protein
MLARELTREAARRLGQELYMDPLARALVLPANTEVPDTRLRGPRLLVARAVWVTLFALGVVWFGGGLVAQVIAIEHPCGAVLCVVKPAQAETLRHLGIGLGTLALYFVGLQALTVLASLVLAVLLFWRRSDDWLALVVGLFLLYPVVTFATGPNDVGVSVPLLGLPLSFTAPIIVVLSYAEVIVYYGVFLIFPDGRFAPRWAWLLLVAWGAHQLADFAAQLGGNSFNLPGWVALSYPVLYLGALGIQVYRFRRVSNLRQRQQTKWVVLGVAVTLLANITFWIVLPTADPAFQQPSGFYLLVAYPLYQLVSIALPVSFVLAIQRHQLFDVDVLIKRTLVYGTLTVILAALYFGIVLGAQAVTQPLTGQGEQPIIIVASTLLIAALFTPLRSWLQAIIDRRFYRTKYDAARTLAAFGGTVRSETDLSALCAQLIAVVEETMQPVSVSLWLRDGDKPPLDEHTGGSD